MAKKPVVYQSNPLVEGHRDFSLMETRLFYIGLRDVIPRLTEKDIPWNKNTYKEFPTTIIEPAKLIEIFGNHKYYSTLHNICREFAKKTVEIKDVDGDGWSVYPLFAELTYKKAIGLRLEFNPKMIPWLLDLADKPFTKLPFEQVWALRSSYAIRLFELLLQYQNTKTHERTLSIEEIRQCLGVPKGTYESMDNLKRRVIMSSIKDINEKTSYKIEYEPVKEKRKIVAFKFKLHLPAEIKKEKRKEQIKNIGKITEQLAKDKDLNTKSEMTEEQKELGKRKIAEFMKKMKA